MSDVIWYIFFIGIFVLLLVVILLIVLDWRKDRKAAINGTKEPQQPVVIYIGKDGKVSTDSDKVLIKQEEVVEEVKEVKEEPQPVSAEKAPDGTVIKFAERQTYHEAYLDLTTDKKEFVDKLNKLAAELDSKIKVNESKYHVLAKYLSYRLYELKIAKGYVKASFFISSSEFKQFQKNVDDVAIKEKPTVIYLNNEKSLDAANDLLKIVYGQAKEAKENKKGE